MKEKDVDVTEYMEGVVLVKNEFLNAGFSDVNIFHEAK